MSDAPGYHRQRRFALPDDATEVVLVRHGASAPVARGDLHELADDGRGDPPLAPEGEAEAIAVAERLLAEPEPLRTLFVSGLRRTVQTAAPLVARLGIEPVEIVELREIHLGEWEGGEFRIRMREADATAMQAVREERWDLIPGAEPMDDFAARVRRGIERVVELAGPGTTAAFVHGAVIGELCRQATDSRRFAFVHADNASLSRLVVFADGHWLLRAFNETTHLP